MRFMIKSQPLNTNGYQYLRKNKHTEENPNINTYMEIKKKKSNMCLTIGYTIMQNEISYFGVEFIF